MIAYHFLPANYALDDMRRQRIKISELDQLNDPFELWSAAQPTLEDRKVLRNFKKKMAQTRGILSFTRSWDNPVLWSHYADRHRGICLGFEVQDDLLQDVTYVSDREPLELPATEATVNKLLFTKFSDWSYERELRCWATLDQRDSVNGHYFGNFDDKIELREVIAGPLCEVAKSRIDAALSAYRDPPVVMKARLAFKTFRIVPNKQGFQR